MTMLDRWDIMKDKHLHTKIDRLNYSYYCLNRVKEHILNKLLPFKVLSHPNNYPNKNGADINIQQSQSCLNNFTFAKNFAKISELSYSNKTNQKNTQHNIIPPSQSHPNHQSDKNDQNDPLN